MDQENALQNDINELRVILAAQGEEIARLTVLVSDLEAKIDNRQALPRGERPKLEPVDALLVTNWAEVFKPGQPSPPILNLNEFFRRRIFGGSTTQG